MLSIIIVNYRSVELIKANIKSIEQYNPGFEYEIIVVDNSSVSGEKEDLISFSPSVQWISMASNAGFARANNVGMKLAKGEVYLLLNPDTVSIDNSISSCYQKLLASDFSAAGVQLLDELRQPHISGSFFMKGGLNHLLPLPYWGGLLRWIGYQSKTKIPNVKEAGMVEEVDWISGAFLMVKKEAVEKAGMMDEDFFLYAEEVEWCSRIGKIGKLCIYGELHIIHLEGASINKEQNSADKGYYNLFDKKGLQLMVSNHLRVRKQYGSFWFLFLLLNYTWGIFFYLIMSTLHRIFTLRNPFGDWGKVMAFGKNVIILWSLVPKIISNRPHFYKMF